MKNKSRTNSAYTSMQNFIFYLSMSLLAVLLIILLAVVIGSIVTLRTRIFHNPALVYLTATGTLLLLFLFFMIEKQIINSSNSKIRIGNRIFLFIGILFIQLMFLTQLGKIDLTTDSFRIIDMASEMTNHTHGLIKNTITDTDVDAYFSKYGNNHFIVIFFYYFFRLVKFFGSTDFRFWARMLNVLFIDGSIFLSYLTAKKLSNQKRADSFLAFILICPTTYVWLFWTYTNTMSLPFTMGLLLLSVFAFQTENSKHNILYAIGMGLLAAFGYHIRPTVILTVITLCITSLFFSKKQNSGKKAILFCFTFLLCFAIGSVSLSQFTKKHLQDPACTGQFPITHWLMLGLSEHGQYNFDDVDYTTSFVTKEKKQAANIKVIKERIYSRTPQQLFSFGCEKLYNVFGDGPDQYTQQSTYQEHQTRLFEIIYGRKNTLPRFYCKIFRLMELFLLFTSVIVTIRKKDKTYISYFINYLGAMLFFLIWEANKKYNLSFEWILLLLSADGLFYIFTFFNKTLHSIKPSTSASHSIFAFFVSYKKSIFILLTGITLMTTFVYGEKNFSEDTYTTLKKAVVIRSGKYNDIETLSSKYESIRQTFETSFSFDHILVRADIDPSNTKGYYIFRLYDENNVTLMTQNVNYKNAITSERGIYVSLPRTLNVNGDNHTYTLRIERNRPSTKFLHFKVMSYQAIDRYASGHFYLDNILKTNLDLACTAYSEKMETEISPVVYKNIEKVLFSILVMIFITELLFERKKSKLQKSAMH